MTVHIVKSRGNKRDQDKRDVGEEYRPEPRGFGRFEQVRTHSDEERHARAPGKPRAKIKNTTQKKRR